MQPNKAAPPVEWVPIVKGCHDFCYHVDDAGRFSKAISCGKHPDLLDCPTAFECNKEKALRRMERLKITTA